MKKAELPEQPEEIAAAIIALARREDRSTLLRGWQHRFKRSQDFGRLQRLFEERPP
jgi:hypothetical protein